MLQETRGMRPKILHDLATSSDLKMDDVLCKSPLLTKLIGFNFQHCLWISISHKSLSHKPSYQSFRPHPRRQPQALWLPILQGAVGLPSSIAWCHAHCRWLLQAPQLSNIPSNKNTGKLLPNRSKWLKCWHVSMAICLPVEVSKSDSAKKFEPHDFYGHSEIDEMAPASLTSSTASDSGGASASAETSWFGKQLWHLQCKTTWKQVETR